METTGYSRYIEHSTQEPATANGGGKYHSDLGPSADSGELSLHDLLEIVLKGKWIILAFFFSILAVTALYTFTVAPEYEASSLIQVNTDQSTPELGDLFGLEGGFRNVLNEIEILKSRTIGLAVADELVRDYDFSRDDFTALAPNPEQGSLRSQDIFVRLRDDYVKVRPVSQDVDFIEIIVSSTNPTEAAVIANLFAEKYLNYNLTASRAKMTALREFLDDISNSFATELQSAENDLSGFLNREAVVAPDEEARQLLGQVTELQQSQFQTQVDLGVATAELSALEAHFEEMKPGLAGQISSGDDLIIDRLRAEIADLIVEREQMYAKHPELRADPSQNSELVKLNSQIESLRADLDTRSQGLVEDALASGAAYGSTTTIPGSGGKLGSLSELRMEITEKQIEVSALEAKLEVINSNMTTYQNELGRLPNQELILNRLSRTVQTQEQLYVALVEKLQEAKIAERSELGYVEVIDTAVAPADPVRPRIPLNLALGGLVGLLFGIAAAFIKNALDNKIRKPEDVRKLGLNVIGAIPSLERIVKNDFDGQSRVTVADRSYDTNLITLLNPLSPIAEGYRRLRTNIQFSDPDRVIRTVMVTSAEPGEGKTITSTNLAVALAQSGRKTLYVDCDLRRARGHRIFGVNREPGLVDLLFDAMPAGVENYASEIDNLYIIPAGRKIPNPAEVLESKKMSDFLNRMKQEFDIVVIDSAPVLAVTDALILGRQTDTTLLICSANTTSWQALDTSSTMLVEMGAHLTGVMLNRFDNSSGGSGYSYAYGYHYQDYYGQNVDD